MRLGKGTLALAVLLYLGISASGLAQSTTGTLRGTVTDETGGSLPGGTVTATNDDTGFSRFATTAASGFYNISLPPGPYTVVVTLPSFATVTQKVRIQVGDTQTFDVRMLLEARQQAAVTVSAEAPVIETKSNEVATNVSEEQIKQLPQDNRNFLSFAALAPGVRYNDSDLSKTITSGAVGADNVNVFIDGTSFKNDVLTGGVS